MSTQLLNAPLRLQFQNLWNHVKQCHKESLSQVSAKPETDIPKSIVCFEDTTSVSRIF